MTDQTHLDQSAWKWLEGTYWVVPPENLTALRLDPAESSLAWVVDQTVWNITGYRNGYFWGVSATLFRDSREEIPQRGPGSQPVGFAMLGSITPEGRVYLSFVPSVASSSRSVTIGIGRAVPHQDTWSLEMQMSSGSQELTAHWAYMVRVQPGDPSWDSVPGIGLSVPQMLEGLEPPHMKPA